MAEYVRPEVFSLKTSPDYNEKWVQAKIAEDPSILGLGDLALRDSERVQPTGGRLDLLLHDPETNRRYEVELQLGKTDEAHIIRAIEYWDTERRRYPQYEHCAVLVAEDITSRFLNVISLFNGHIPLIAVQMKALAVKDAVSLFFTTVVDQITLGAEEEEPEPEPTDRLYWEKKGSPRSLAVTDSLHRMASEIAPGYGLKYNKHYIGLAKDGVSENFVSFVPRRSAVILHVKHPQSEEIQKLLDSTDLDVLSYDRQWNQYRLRLNDADVAANTPVLSKLMELAYENYMQ